MTTDIPSTIPAVSQHAPWNKGKIVGPEGAVGERPKNI